jgi:hypothetical protein
MTLGWSLRRAEDVILGEKFFAPTGTPTIRGYLHDTIGRMHVGAKNLSPAPIVSLRRAETIFTSIGGIGLESNAVKLRAEGPP